MTQNSADIKIVHGSSAESDPTPAPPIAVTRPVPNGQGAPDWSAVAEEIQCPLCEYNLRGLAEPRCPECGYRFEWPNLLDASRRLHPYLFEHHPDRPIWSFWRTLAGGLHPLKFWRSLQPVQPVRPRRLAVYAGILLLVTLGISVVFVADSVLQIRRRHQAEHAWGRMYLNSQRLQSYRAEIVKKWGSVDAFLDQAYPLDPLAILVTRLINTRDLTSRFALSLGVITWLVSTRFALGLFEFTRRRARIQRIHFSRCVIYCGDVVVWLTVAVVALLVVGGILLGMSVGPPPRFGVLSIRSLQHIINGLVSTAAALFLARLYSALRDYLRFPHAGAVMLAVNAIAILATLNVLLIFNRL